MPQTQWHVRATPGILHAPTFFTSTDEDTFSCALQTDPPTCSTCMRFVMFGIECHVQRQHLGCFVLGAWGALSSSAHCTHGAVQSWRPRTS